MLYIVATPIGNLEDISLRAIETLKKTDLIIAENPSHTQKLLAHYQIAGKKFVQFAEHNELKILDRLIGELKNADGALISDAGTPGISDPGFRLVRECIKNGIKVIPIPGPSAAIAALSASGLPTDKFLFFGFLPKTEIKLIKELEGAKTARATAIFYESPQRLIKTLGYIAKAYPNAQTVAARELTKIHEEFIRGSAAEILKTLSSKSSIKGELTILISFKSSIL